MRPDYADALQLTAHRIGSSPARLKAEAVSQAIEVGLVEWATEAQCELAFQKGHDAPPRVRPSSGRSIGALPALSFHASYTRSAGLRTPKPSRSPITTMAASCR